MSASYSYIWKRIDSEPPIHQANLFCVEEPASEEWTIDTLKAERQQLVLKEARA